MRSLFFAARTVLDALRKNKSAGWIFRAAAIFTIISKDGSAFPHSMQAIVPVAQSQASASFSWNMSFLFVIMRQSIDF